MAKKGYTPEQIINKLREAEIQLRQGASIAVVSKIIGVRSHTYYRWHKEYGRIRVEQAKKLKTLEKENTRLKKLVTARAHVKVIRLHDARHIHASLMLKQGIHPKIVQERLGHASIQMTLDTYSHVAPGLQQVAADSFDKPLNSRHEKEAVENHY